MDALETTKSLGGRWHGGYGTAPCPVCQPERRPDQNGLSLCDDAGRLLAYCHKSGCKFGDIIRAAGNSRDIMPLKTSAKHEIKANHVADRVERRAKARNIWQRALSISGTKAEAYLRARGITVPLPDSLKFLPDTYHVPSGRWVCAMVADVQQTGGVHRTFFTKWGERIADNAKMMLGPCAGGAVRLSYGAGPLVVCEGLETGLSLVEMLSERSPKVWAALSTSGMKALTLPAESGELTIATDGDEPGREAGNFLATKAIKLGWKIRLMPAPEGQDWNDVLMAMRAAA